MIAYLAAVMRFAIGILLAAALAPVCAETTRIAIIYAGAEEVAMANIASLIGSIEETPGIEIIRLDLDSPRGDLAAQLLFAAGAGSGPVRLAAAGGTVGPIAVLYPDIGEPYRSVFTKIIEGIEDRARSRVAAYAVGNSFNAEELSVELRKQDIRVVIALGRHGLKAASALDKDIGVVASGVISVPENESRPGTVLSLAPDPGLLFARLKSISPATRRVTVIYEPRQNAWLIRLAAEAARTAGLDLVAQEATDLREALRLYQEFFATADGRRDALWLLQDSTTSDEATVLPLVLQESWNRYVPIFSSAVSHVKRGALFALYPNNVELGRDLANSALGIAGGTQTSRGVLPLRNVLTAFNTRTASHLGLTRGTAKLPAFDLVFPEQ